MAFRDYFAKLFTAELSAFCEGLPSLGSEDGLVGYAETDQKELWYALKSMNTPTSPGPDGIVTGFYLRFFDISGDAITDLVNILLRDGHKPQSFCEGRVMLLLKEDMEPGDPKLWRAITLLNTEYKLVATLIWCLRP